MYCAFENRGMQCTHNTLTRWTLEEGFGIHFDEPEPDVSRNNSFNLNGKVVFVESVISEERILIKIDQY